MGTGEVMHLTVRQLYHLLGDLQLQDPAMGDRLVVLGHDPEGNPPFHALTHEDTGEGAGFAPALVSRTSSVTTPPGQRAEPDQPALVLWAGYPQYWDDDIAWGANG